MGSPKAVIVHNLRELIRKANENGARALQGRTDHTEPEGFAILRESAQLAFRQLGEFGKLDVTNVSRAALSELDARLQLFVQRLEYFNNSVVVATPMHTDSVANETADAADELSKVLGPLLTVTTVKAMGDLIAMREHLDRQIASADESARMAEANTTAAYAVVEKSKTDLAAKMSEVEKIVQAVKNAAGLAGMTTHVREFEALADAHKTSSGNWLKATAAVAGVCLLVVIAFAFVPVPDKTTGVLVQYALTRAFLFVLVSYAIVWTGRNYRAHRHLQVLNEHRQKALTTFEAFTKAALDDATKNAILLETTRSIFAQTATGYADEEPAGPADRIVEIIKTMGDRS